MRCAPASRLRLRHGCACIAVAPASRLCLHRGCACVAAAAVYRMRQRGLLRPRAPLLRVLPAARVLPSRLPSDGPA